MGMTDPERLTGVVVQYTYRCQHAGCATEKVDSELAMQPDEYRPPRPRLPKGWGYVWTHEGTRLLCDQHLPEVGRG